MVVDFAAAAGGRRRKIPLALPLAGDWAR